MAAWTAATTTSRVANRAAWPYDCAREQTRERRVTAKRIISWTIGAPVAVLLICFAVANRHWITVSFDPVSKDNPWLALSMPAFMLLFIGIFIGLLVGGAVVWLRQGKWRKQARVAQAHEHDAVAAARASATSGSTGLTRLPGPAN